MGVGEFRPIFLISFQTFISLFSIEEQTSALGQPAPPALCSSESARPHIGAARTTIFGSQRERVFDGCKA
jgi:hypothetical protein